MKYLNTCCSKKNKVWSSTIYLGTQLVDLLRKKINLNWPIVIFLYIDSRITLEKRLHVISDISKISFNLFESFSYKIIFLFLKISFLKLLSSFHDGCSLIIKLIFGNFIEQYLINWIKFSNALWLSKGHIGCRKKLIVLILYIVSNGFVGFR